MKRLHFVFGPAPEYEGDASGDQLARSFGRLDQVERPLDSDEIVQSHLGGRNVDGLRNPRECVHDCLGRRLGHELREDRCVECVAHRGPGPQLLDHLWPELREARDGVTLLDQQPHERTAEGARGAGYENVQLTSC